MAGRSCQRGLNLLILQHISTTNRILSGRINSNCISLVSWNKTGGEEFGKFGVSSRSFHLSPLSYGVTPVKMPSLSPTMSEGVIVKWNKKEGDSIAPGDVLCEIQTDKAVVSLEIEDEGILAKILLPENSPEVKVGTPIALLVDEGEDWKNVEVPADLEQAPPTSSQTSEPVQSQPTGTSAGSSSQPQTHQSSGAGDRLMGPSVRTILTQYGLSPEQVNNSGPHSNLLKGDVLRHIKEQNLQPLDFTKSDAGTSKKGPTKAPQAKPSKGAPFKDIEVTNMRRTIAKRLLQSKSTIPHAYGTTRCSISSMMQLRKKFQASGVKVSVNDFIIKCSANALAKCPPVNVIWEGDNVVQKSQIDISVAVATESGLITPIVVDVAEKDVIRISDTVRELAEKAKSGKLQPAEFMGGTFTISNLGMFGVHHFSAIINPPQCAILAVGGGHTFVDENGELDSSIGLTLSYDARAISEDTAAKFLAHLKDELEGPSETSLGIYNLGARVEAMNLYN